MKKLLIVFLVTSISGCALSSAYHKKVNDNEYLISAGGNAWDTKETLLKTITKRAKKLCGDNKYKISGNNSVVESSISTAYGSEPTHELERVVTCVNNQEILSYDTASSNKVSFLLNKFADDASYGYETFNPINVGDGDLVKGPLNQRLYLNALRGPNGEEIKYRRRGSCCSFQTKNGISGTGLLDIYEITYSGLKEPILLYLNFYDPGDVLIPIGLNAQ